MSLAHRSLVLIGELDPAFADAMERNLSETWGDDAVGWADEHTILVRPAIGLLANRHNTETVFVVVNGTAMPGPLVDPETGCGSVELKTMKDSKVTDWRRDWGLWPWNTLDEDGVVALWLRGFYKDE